MGLRNWKADLFLLSHHVEVIKVFKMHLLAGDEEESVMSPFSRQPSLMSMTLADRLMCAPLGLFSW